VQAMKTTIDWLDAAKAKHGLSDYALAPLLGVSKAQMSRYRNGHDTLSDDVALKLADLLGMDPKAIIGCAHAERAKTDGARKFWERFGATAGLVAFVAAGSTFPGRVDAKTMAMHDDAGARLYIMSNQ
jgi:transcriptional regulator with XRE-family HTH domain